MPQLDSIKTWSEIGQNITLSVAAIVTAYLGAKGLTAWRCELSGRAKFEAARNILKALYEARDSAFAFLNSLRPVPWADYNEQNQRWSLFNEKIRELQSLSLELEVNFGVRMRDKILPLLSLAAASDQMFLENGASKMTIDQLQSYLKPPLLSHVIETVKNIECILSKHTR